MKKDGLTNTHQFKIVIDSIFKKINCFGSRKSEPARRVKSNSIKEVYALPAHLCAYGAFKSPATLTAGESRPDQPSFLNGVKNEGCRAEAKDKSGP